MREGQKRINVYLPESLYSAVLRSEYKDITEAVIKGLTVLLEAPGEDFERAPNTNTLESSNYLQEELIRSLRNHIESLESQIMVKDEQLRTQAVHLQTVLTQKYIAPPEKSTKKAKNEYNTEEHNQVDSSYIAKDSSHIAKDSSPAARKEENKKEITCLYCGETFTAERSTRKFCSGKCKTAYNRKQKS